MIVKVATLIRCEYQEGHRRHDSTAKGLDAEKLASRVARLREPADRKMRAFYVDVSPSLN